MLPPNPRPGVTLQTVTVTLLSGQSLVDFEHELLIRSPGAPAPQKVGQPRLTKLPNYNLSVVDVDYDSITDKVLWEFYVDLVARGIIAAFLTYDINWKTWTMTDPDIFPGTPVGLGDVVHVYQVGRGGAIFQGVVVSVLKPGLRGEFEVVFEGRNRQVVSRAYQDAITRIGRTNFGSSLPHVHTGWLGLEP